MIAASRLDYNPADITLKTKKSDYDEPRRCGTDRGMERFLAWPQATRDKAGRVCLIISALTDVEDELLLSHARWSPTITTIKAALVPVKPGIFTKDDVAVLHRLADLQTVRRQLPFPTHRDDWLAQFNESRESVAVIQRNEGTGRSSIAGGDICLLPIQCSGDAPLPMEEVVAYATAFFDRPVKLLPAATLTRPTKGAGAASLLGKGIGYRTYCAAAEKRMDHGQFRAGDILSALSGRRKKIPGLPEGYRALIGVTMSDLYISDDDEFTQGLATIGGSCGVGCFSFLRYTSNWSQSSKEASAANVSASDCGRVANYAAKTAVHEILHVYGLGHCTYA